MNQVRLTVVVDNHAARGLTAEHGFALWLQHDGRTIMFDTGNKEALLPNAQALGLDLSRVSELVVSHGHYDHTGGIDVILEQSRDVEVYLHQAAFEPRYVGKNGSTEPVRMPGRSTQALGHLKDEAVHWMTRGMQLSKNIGITGPIPRINSFEDTGGAFYYDQEGKRPDPIDDDIAIWLRTSEGLVVCVGCSHAGIVNTLNSILETSKEETVHTIIGGLHLLNASEDRLKQTARELNEFGIKKLVACHCTGAEAITYLKKHLDGEVIRGYAGFSMSYHPEFAPDGA
jgi:7,8-dihydropterin-6-yl-methyl-4-(beta-D-ribofuranosyl)aminobenzene 5'-phosphate synthase